MYLQLFLLFVSFCTYTADEIPIATEQPTAVATYQNSNGIESITYTREGVTVTFPAEILLKSDTINDLLANCSQDVPKDRRQALVQAAQWLLDNIDTQNLQKFTQMLQLSPQEFAAKINNFVYLSIEQTKSLLVLSNKFNIQSIYDPLTTHVANNRELWAYMPDDDIAYDITQKIDPDYLCKLQNFLYTQCHYTTSYYCNKKRRLFGSHKSLNSTCKQLIKTHISDDPIIKVNPTNPAEIFVYNHAHRTCLIFNQNTNEYHIFQAPWYEFQAKYSSDGKKIELSHKRSINHTYKNIYIFDIAAKKTLFEGNGKANCNKNIVYGLASSDLQYRFHFLDTQKTSTPWLEARQDITFNPNGKIFAVKSCWHDIEFYDIEHLKNDPCNLSPLKTLSAFGRAKVAYNTDGSELLILHDLDKIILYDGNTLTPIGKLLLTQGYIRNARFNDDNKKIIIEYNDPYQDVYSTIIYRHINLRQLPLACIGELAKAFETDWKNKCPYRVESEQQLIRFHEMVPELLANDNLFTVNQALHEEFKKIVKGNLEVTLGRDAQYFDTAKASRYTVKLWHKAQQYWQENDMKPYPLFFSKDIDLVASNVPIDVALRLFTFDNNTGYDKLLKDRADENIHNLDPQLDRTLRNIILNTYTKSQLAYFIMALKHIKDNNTPYTMPLDDRDFAHIKASLYCAPTLNALFDDTLISEYSYRYLLATNLWHSSKFSLDQISTLELTKSTLQFLNAALAFFWKNKKPHPLETQEDLNHCFAFNQELYKPKHAPMAQELRSHNLFALSEDAAENIRAQYLGKVFQRLRAKRITTRNHLRLLHDLTTKQLNMLFRASYQPYQLQQEDLDAYCQLPLTFRREKLFGQDIFNNTKDALRREFNRARPSRLAESFANIAFNVKRLVRSDGTWQGREN